jgi:hypothetical protein
MSHPPSQPAPVHNILFTIPRTASHLLIKLLNLSSQPSILCPANNKDGYLFLPALVQRFKNNLTERPIGEWSEADKKGTQEALQAGFDDWVTLIEHAEDDGRGTYVKEHINWLLDPILEARALGSTSPTDVEGFEVSWSGGSKEQERNMLNLTCLPTNFLLNSVKPTFLIRHPALTFPSALRTTIDIEGLSVALASERTQRWECTYAWTLSLYRLYTQTPGFRRATLVDDIKYPIVLDASDLSNEGMVKRYARAVGLDEEKVQFEWQVAGKEEVEGVGKAEQRMKSTINASKGVDKGKLGGGEVDLGMLEREWREEFGDVLAERVGRLVGASMPAYEELWGLRLRHA